MKTVKELKEILATMPDDAVVVMSRDSEGNDFGPLCDVSQGKYEADSTYSGEFVNADDIGDSDGVACVALWPVN